MCFEGGGGGKWIKTWDGVDGRVDMDEDEDGMEIDGRLEEIVENIPGIYGSLLVVEERLGRMYCGAWWCM